MTSPYREGDVRVPAIGKIVQIAVSDRGMVALDDQGLVWVAGSNYTQGQKWFYRWQLAVPPDDST